CAKFASGWSGYFDYW
nr:immunoglobulin heavy chain junction region [Macaca mulatta]